MSSTKICVGNSISNTYKRKLSKSNGILKKARRTLNSTTLIQIYYSFLYPYFSALPLWGETNKSLIKPLELIQKKTVRPIFNKKNSTPSSPLSVKAQILPLEHIYLLSTLVFMFKIHHNKLPSIIQSKFTKRYNISTQKKDKLISMRYPTLKQLLLKDLYSIKDPKRLITYSPLQKLI